MRMLLLISLVSFSFVLNAQTTTSTNANSSGNDNNAAADATANSPQTVCKSGSDERTVEIIYETAGAKIPCRVDYTKAGATNTLWQAANEEGYCESKAQALIEKLTNAGFDCQ